MADLTASGATPAVIWDAGAAGDSSGDWKAIDNAAGALVFQTYTTAWFTKFTLDPAETISKQDLRIITSAPVLYFEDTTGTGGTYDWQIRVDGGALYVEVQTGAATYSARLQSDGTYVCANNGMGAGSTSSTNVLRWSRHATTLSTTASATTITLLYNQKVIGATVMVQNSDSGTGYDVCSWQYAPPAASPSSYYNRFHVRLNRLSGGDTVVITDVSDASASDNYAGREVYVVAFYEP
jgi:hypothetical protein